MEFDYEEVEQRLLALARSGDFPKDPHADTAREVFGEVTEETRRAAKAINFRAIYGGPYPKRGTA